MLNKPPDDIITHALKQRWFQLALTEDYGRTPQVTAELDRLEEAIRELKAKPAAGPVRQA